jgi:hypothetical protein
MLVLLVLDTPTPRRVILGGVLAGVTLLVKPPRSTPLVAGCGGVDREARVREVVALDERQCLFVLQPGLVDDRVGVLRGLGDPVSVDRGFVLTMVLVQTGDVTPPHLGDVPRHVDHGGAIPEA